MKLKEIVPLMNMAQLDVASRSRRWPGGLKRINMFDIDHDEILCEYGDCTIDHITNIAFSGVTIWINLEEE